MGQLDDARLESRLEALAARIDAALARAHARIAKPEAGGGANRAELEALRSELDTAEANAELQAQRCAALEDRIVELEAALVGARETRARAEALAENAQREASLALDQLELARSERSAPTPIDPNLGATLQEKLLEIERLTRERDGLRETSSEWRTKAQAYRRERDEATLGLSRTQSELEDLRERDAAARRKIGELERKVSEKERALEVATRRAEHLRQHLGS